MNLKVTNVYARHNSEYHRLKSQNVETPIIIHEGGSRSSKTVSIIQWLAEFCRQSEIKKEVSIFRLKRTWLMETVFKNFDWFVHEYGVDVYPQLNPRRPAQEYELFGSLWSFVGLDDKMKLHGREQDISWTNEAMEVKEDDFRQIELRTKELQILDYNPMSLEHWVYNLSMRPESSVVHSTQLDNPFLAPGIRKRILSYKPTPKNIAQGTADKYHWDVYGLGKKAAQKGRVFKNIRITQKWPEENGVDACKWTVYGLDFGYTNDPTAIIKLGLFGGALYMKELLYEEGLTNIPGLDSDDTDNIHSRLKELGLTSKDIIRADSAESKSIAELKKYKWKVEPAPKGPDSIRSGLDALKRYPIYLVLPSLNLKREFDNYKYKEDADGKLTNVPVDNFNHLIDAARYAATKYISKKKSTFRSHY